MTSADPYGAGTTRPATPPRPAPGAPVTAPIAGARDWHDARVITGEAVALELAPASALSRLMSGMIDVIVYLAFGVGLLILAGRFSANMAQMGTASIVTIAVMMVILPCLTETVTRGLSAGKVAVGLRIVRDDGGPIRFRHAFIRSLTGIGEIWLSLGSVALISSMIHPRSKRLGDMVAGTYSLRVRETEVATAPLLMPPELRSWAQLADIRRLPDALALYARIYLSRTGELHPRVRTDVGRSFASALEPYVAPPPPWGTDPERFIAAVLVARRDAEYLAGQQRAQREQAEARRARVLPYGIADAPAPR